MDNLVSVYKMVNILAKTDEKIYKILLQHAGCSKAITDQMNQSNSLEDNITKIVSIYQQNKRNTNKTIKDIIDKFIKNAVNTIIFNENIRKFLLIYDKAKFDSLEITYSSDNFKYLLSKYVDDIDLSRYEHYVVDTTDVLYDLYIRFSSELAKMDEFKLGITQVQPTNEQIDTMSNVDDLLELLKKNPFDETSPDLRFDIFITNIETKITSFMTEFKKEGIKVYGDGLELFSDKSYQTAYNDIFKDDIFKKDIKETLSKPLDFGKTGINFRILKENAIDLKYEHSQFEILEYKNKQLQRIQQFKKEIIKIVVSTIKQGTQTNDQFQSNILKLNSKIFDIITKYLNSVSCNITIKTINELFDKDMLTRTLTCSGNNKEELIFINPENKKIKEYKINSQYSEEYKDEYKEELIKENINYILTILYETININKIVLPNPSGSNITQTHQLKITELNKLLETFNINPPFIDFIKKIIEHINKVNNLINTKKQFIECIEKITITQLISDIKSLKNTSDKTKPINNDKPDIDWCERLMKLINTLKQFIPNINSCFDTLFKITIIQKPTSYKPLSQFIPLTKHGETLNSLVLQNSDINNFNEKIAKLTEIADSTKKYINLNKDIILESLNILIKTTSDTTSQNLLQIEKQTELDSNTNIKLNQLISDCKTSLRDYQNLKKENPNIQIIDKMLNFKDNEWLDKKHKYFTELNEFKQNKQNIININKYIYYIDILIFIVFIIYNYKYFTNNSSSYLYKIKQRIKDTKQRIKDTKKEIEEAFTSINEELVLINEELQQVIKNIFLFNKEIDKSDYSLDNIDSKDIVAYIVHIILKPKYEILEQMLKDLDKIDSNIIDKLYLKYRKLVAINFNMIEHYKRTLSSNILQIELKMKKITDTITENDKNNKYNIDDIINKEYLLYGKYLYNEIVSYFDNFKNTTTDKMNYLKIVIYIFLYFTDIFKTNHELNKLLSILNNLKTYQATDIGPIETTNPKITQIIKQLNSNDDINSKDDKIKFLFDTISDNIPIELYHDNYNYLKEFINNKLKLVYDNIILKENDTKITEILKKINNFNNILSDPTKTKTKINEVSKDLNIISDEITMLNETSTTKKSDSLPQYDIYIINDIIIIFNFNLKDSEIYLEDVKKLKTEFESLDLNDIKKKYKLDMTIKTKEDFESLKEQSPENINEDFNFITEKNIDILKREPKPINELIETLKTFIKNKTLERITTKKLTITNIPTHNIKKTQLDQYKKALEWWVATNQENKELRDKNNNYSTKNNQYKDLQLQSKDVYTWSLKFYNYLPIPYIKSDIYGNYLYIDYSIIKSYENLLFALFTKVFENKELITSIQDTIKEEIIIKEHIENIKDKSNKDFNEKQITISIIILYHILCIIYNTPTIKSNYHFIIYVFNYIYNLFYNLNIDKLFEETEKVIDNPVIIGEKKPLHEYMTGIMKYMTAIKFNKLIT
jgi:hypothetical protein